MGRINNKYHLKHDIYILWESVNQKPSRNRDSTTIFVLEVRDKLALTPSLGFNGDGNEEDKSQSRNTIFCPAEWFGLCFCSLVVVISKTLWPAGDWIHHFKGGGICVQYKLTDILA